MTTFATIADKMDTVGCNTDDDVCGADNGLCWETPIKAVVGYAESRSNPRPEAVNDQLDLRIIDMGNIFYDSQSRANYDWLIECLKRDVWGLSPLGGQEY